MLFMLNGYYCVCKIFTATFRNLTFLFWWSHLMKFYQTVLQSQKKCSVQNWKHFYCDVICFHGSPLCSLQITSGFSWHWSHIIECNIFDGISVIERWVWLDNCDYWFYTDQSSVDQIWLAVLGGVAEKHQRIILLRCRHATSYTMGQTSLVFRWACFILNAQQVNVYNLVVLMEGYMQLKQWFSVGVFPPIRNTTYSNLNFSDFLRKHVFLGSTWLCPGDIWNIFFFLNLGCQEIANSFIWYLKA